MNSAAISIEKYAYFSPDQLALFESKLIPVSFKKGEYILKEGSVCNGFYFLEQGACRHFTIDANGNERMLNLCVAGDWFADQQSFTRQKPSVNRIMAFADCETKFLNVQSLHELMNTAPTFFQLGKLMEVFQYPQYAMTRDMPDDNYLDLLQNRPQLLQAFPLKDIAAYLGITPETLSRIRKRISS